jgi:iron complex outermembrane receptor protein
MKARKYLPLLFVFTFILTSHIQAQTSTGQISGIVLSPENEPSEYSTVVLMNKDSVFMKGALSDTDGAYLFDNLDMGQYFIMIRNVEFNTHVTPPVVVGQNEAVVLDNITLTTRVTGLEEVVIKGEKAMVEVHSDKMVYNVASSVNASGNNGLELLSKSPGVVVDMDKNIILQGKSGVQIYINGRPSRVEGSDLTNMLEGMRSDNIASIEIITNPSAKYDSEGTGGIINIVLKTNAETGFNGNLIANYSRGFRSRSSVGTSLNYSGPKISLFSSFNLSDDDYLQQRNEAMLREAYLLDMKSEDRDTRRGLNFSGGMDYRINSEHSLSVDARILVNNRGGNLESNTGIYDVSGVLDPQLLVAGALGDGRSENYNANIHYSFVPNRSSSLSTDVSFGTYSNSNYTIQPNEYWDIDKTNLIRTVENQYDANTDINLFSAMVDYEKSVEKFTFSVGAKYSYINTNNRLAYFNVENDTPA